MTNSTFNNGTFNNAWDALAKTPEEAARLQARTALLREISYIIKANG